MTSQLDLTTDEQRLLALALRDLSVRRGRQVTLGALLKDWRSCVTDVEKGYSLSVYDYSNDLSCRDALEEIQSQVSDPLRSKLSVLIGPIDETFLRVTVQTPKPVAGGQGGWWWARVPTKLCPELAEDLRGQGILE